MIFYVRAVFLGSDLIVKDKNKKLLGCVEAVNVKAAAAKLGFGRALIFLLS